jgi:RNA polymerase sigma-70 factor (ECF subfamily)
MAPPLALDAVYEEHRRFLWSVCYRMTGSAADAEDVVQETFVRAIERPPQRTDEPIRPWLVTVALNLARDRLRRRRRREYIGPWLPSPIETGLDEAREPPSHEPATFEGRYDLLESVSLAFLVALEALTPRGRAVLILRDVFDYTVKETADALDLSEANVKTSHHRARKAMVAYDGVRQPPTAAVRASTRQALLQFLQGLERHDVGAIETLLAEDVRTTTDGGGEFRSALRTIEGRENVMRFYLAVAEHAANAIMRIPSLNGLPSLVVDLPAPPAGIAPRFTLTVVVNRQGQIAHVYVVSASSKLTALR